MNRLSIVVSVSVAISAVALSGLAACGGSGADFASDLAPDLSLPPQVTQVGVVEPTCCLETTAAAARVMYLANPQPSGTDLTGREVVSKGDLHLADAYGFDVLLAPNVPRNSYIFTPDGNYIIFLQASTVVGDETYAMVVAPLSQGTIGAVKTTTVIARGLDDTPLNQQAFFSGTGRYLIVGVLAPGIMNSPDLTVVELSTARVVFSLPNGSFDYIEQVTADDNMIYENSVASRTPGTPSVEGLYVLPLAAAASGAQPALIDTKTTNFALSPDQQRIIYQKTDNSLWMFGLGDGAQVQIASDIVAFTVGFATAEGPLVLIKSDLSMHLQYIQHPEILATAPNTVDPWSSFQFSPANDILYYFDRVSSQNATGDMYKLDIEPGQVSNVPVLLDKNVATSSLAFQDNRIRYIRNIDSRGDVGELVTAKLDGSDVQSIAQQVAVGSLQQANPFPPPPTSFKGNPSRGAVDMQAPIVPPVWAQLINAKRDTSVTELLFDDTQPIIGALGFSRENAAPTIIDPMVHINSYQFSPDGYTLLYAGSSTFNPNQAAYLGNMGLYQTLLDQTPTVPMLTGVSELGPIRDRALFVSAPGAQVPGVYFIRY